MDKIHYVLSSVIRRTHKNLFITISTTSFFFFFFRCAANFDVARACLFQSVLSDIVFEKATHTMTLKKILASFFFFFFNFIQMLRCYTAFCQTFSLGTLTGLRNHFKSVLSPESRTLIAQCAFIMVTFR